MDRIAWSPRALVPGADRSVREHKASHGKMARAHAGVVVCVACRWLLCSKLAACSIFRSEEDWNLGEDLRRLQRLSRSRFASQPPLQR